MYLLLIIVLIVRHFNYQTIAQGNYKLKLWLNMVHETINYKLLAIQKFLSCIFYYGIINFEICIGNTGNFEVSVENFGNLQI